MLSRALKDGGRKPSAAPMAATATPAPEPTPSPHPPRQRRLNRARILDLISMICLLGCAVGIHNAPAMTHPEDVVLCLGGSFATCALICYLYLHGN